MHHQLTNENPLLIRLSMVKILIRLSVESGRESIVVCGENGSLTQLMGLKVFAFLNLVFRWVKVLVSNFGMICGMEINL